MGMNYSGGKVDGSSAKVTGITFDSQLDYEGQKVTSKNAIADPVKNETVDLSDFVGAFNKKTPEEIEAERRAEALRKAEEERKRQEEERKRKAAEEEKRRQEELKRLEEERRAEAARQAEAARLAEEKRKQEEAAAAAAAAASQKKGGWSLVGALSSAWNAVTETAAKVVDTTVSVVKDVVNVVEDVACTAAVFTESVIAGAADIVEGAVDGVAWAVAGVADLVGADEFAKDTRGFISTDWVGTAQQAFHENTSLGKYINDNSYASYDSKVMQGVRKGAEAVGEIAAATALTIATGGAAAPFAAGLLVGLGNAAESTYQTNGTDTTLGREAMIAVSGALEGLSWMATGKLGAGFVEMGKTASVIGGREVLSQIKDEVFNKQFLKSVLKEGLWSKNAIGNYISSAFMTGDNLMPYLTGEKDFTFWSALGLGAEYLKNLGWNVLEDGFRSYVGGFKLSDDNAIRIAEEILDGNSTRSLEDILGLNQTSRQKILDCLSPTEIAEGLEKLDIGDYRKIMASLSKDDRLKVIYAQAELAAQDPDKYNAFFRNFREHAALHTGNVRDYAVELSRGVLGVDTDEIYYGAQFHDLGMRGGMFFDKSTGTFRNIDDLTMDDLTLEETIMYIKTSNGFSPKMSDADFADFMASKYGVTNWADNPTLANVPQELLNESFSNKIADLARSNHPLNSAIAILTEDVVPDGVDKNVVALLAMSHSKSTSGIRNFDDPEEWRACVDKLSYALSDAGYSPEEIAPITKGLYDAIDDETTFKRLMDEALCIRDGDAMSALALTPNGDTIMQTGGYSHLEFSGQAKLGSYKDVPTSAADEQAGITDILFDKDGNRTGEVANAFSKKTHAGELNLTFDSAYDGTTYTASIHVVDPKVTPFSTLDSAFERAGEVATYSNCTGRSFEIQLPADMEKTNLGKWYQEEIKKLAAAEILKAQEKGYWSQQLSDFYNNCIKIEWV